MMKYYFIDFENVHSEGFVGLDKVDSGSVIYVVYSENCKNISLDIVEKAERVGVKISAYKAMVGSKNALDFQLSSLLGYVIGQTKEQEDTEYIIIANDSGYDKVVEFWKINGVEISKFSDLSINKVIKNTETSNTKKNSTKGITKTTKEEILKYLSIEEYSDELLNIINSYKTKQAINNGFSKLYKDSKKSGAIYKKLKSLFKEKNKT